VLESDHSAARRLARSFAVHYLELPNYANNLRRTGFTAEDVAGTGSDGVIDATVAWGSVGVIADRVRAHFDAGADHVAVQVLGEAGETGIRGLRDLAPALQNL
jgi:hypothetical protein